MRSAASGSLVPSLTLEAATAEVAGELAAWFPDEKSLVYWGGPEIRFPLEPGQVAELIEEEGTLSFAARRGEALVGFCQLRGFEPEQRCIRAARIAVAPAARGKGTGATMVQLLCREAPSRFAVDRVELFVVADNLPAIRCYTRLGFINLGLQERRLPGPDGDYPLYKMAIDLGVC